MQQSSVSITESFVLLVPLSLTSHLTSHLISRGAQGSTQLEEQQQMAAQLSAQQLVIAQEQLESLFASHADELAASARLLEQAQETAARELANLQLEADTAQQAPDCCSVTH